MAAVERRALRGYLRDLLKDASTARTLVVEAQTAKPAANKRAGQQGQRASLTHAQRTWLEGHVKATHWKGLAADDKLIHCTWAYVLLRL